HADGARRGGRGRRDRRARREVGRASARRRRAEGGPHGYRRRATRLPVTALREVVAARSLRVRRRDPEDERRQVPQDGAAGDVRAAGRDGAVSALKTVWLDNPPVNAVGPAIIDTL